MRLTVTTFLFIWLFALSGLQAEESVARLLAINTATRTVHVQSFIDQAAHLPPAERETLINKLIQLNMPSAILALEKLLETASQKERETIINHFCAYNHDVAVTALINTCTSTNNDVRTYAWEQMKVSYEFHDIFAGNKKLRAFLVTTLRTANNDYRYHAAIALINMGIKEEVDEAEDYLLSILPKTWSDEDHYIIDILAKRGDKRVFPVLCNVLRMNMDDVGHNRQVNAVMSIRDALRSGATINDELREVLIHTAQHAPHYDPASFAADTLGMIKDQKSFDGLLAALATTEASDSVFDALYKISPDRFVAASELILRRDTDNESHSIYLYGRDEEKFIPLFEKFAAIPFSPIDNTSNHNRRESIMALYEAYTREYFKTNDPDTARRKCVRYLESYLNDPDEELVDNVLWYWAMISESDLPKPLADRIIKYFESNNEQKLNIAIHVMSSHVQQFKKQIFDALTMNIENYYRIWMIAGFCQKNNDLPEKQITDLVIKELQSKNNFFWLDKSVLSLVKRSKEPLQLAQDFFNIFAELKEENQKQIMNGLLLGTDKQFLDWMAARWTILSVDVKRTLLTCLSEWSEKPFVINCLVDVLEDCAKQANPLQVLAIKVLAHHTIMGEHKINASYVIHGGLAALQNIPVHTYNSYDAPYDSLREKLLQLSGRLLEGSPNFQTVIDLLLSGTSEVRRTGCVAAQIMGQCDTIYENKFEIELIEKMKNLLHELAKNDSPYIRKEAFRALGWFEDVFTFNELAELFHIDPILQTTIIPLMQSIDYQRTERFLFDHYEMIYVKDRYKHGSKLSVDEGGVYFNEHTQ